ncbi:MAG TPA: hypothetical protein VK974_05345 [Methylophilaceae bacterium]|nr:hypothetical protein [Methylophilaceae bacterium]
MNSEVNCALCLETKELKRSHIIPEFLYKSLYDEKHRLHVLSIIPEQENSIEQKGLREPLLCKDCEEKFSKWERYASLILKGGIELTYRREGNIVFIGGLDFVQFRLFQLSILWRAGVSNLQFFENVQLGKHSEIIRKLLLSSNPGSYDKYGCLMFGIHYEGDAFTSIIMQPGKVRLFGHAGYRFVFGGFMWAFFASSHAIEAPYNMALLQPNGDGLFLIKDVMSMENLESFSKELIYMNRVPKPS